MHRPLLLIGSTLSIAAVSADLPTTARQARPPSPDPTYGLRADNGKGYFVSLAHGWSARMTTWLTQAVLGVRPLEPGMRRVSNRPGLVDLSWVKGKLPTPRGPIELDLHREGESL